MEYFKGILLKEKSPTISTFKKKDIVVSPNNKITYLKETKGSTNTVKYKPNSGLYSINTAQKIPSISLRAVICGNR